MIHLIIYISEREFMKSHHFKLACFQLLKELENLMIKYNYFFAQMKHQMFILERLLRSIEFRVKDHHH